MNKKIKWMILLVLVLAAVPPILLAQNEAPLLPGSAAKLDRIVSQADTIVVAKLLSLGITIPDSPGQANYDSAQIQVASILKGLADHTLTVSISVQYLKGRVEEIAPKEGQEYLFFIHTDEAHRKMVLKVLPATDDNTAKIKALLAATPGGK